MKRLLVLGAGTAGTMAVNKLRPQLPRDEWSITVVDADDTHYYQPGYLFVPFGIYRPDEIVKPKKRFIPTGVDLVLGEIDKVVPEENKVLLVDGTELGYDYLIIASGTTPRPEETPGMADDLGGSVHEFYTFAGATALAEKLRTWEGGRLVVHITEMPIKCPVAPLEFEEATDPRSRHRRNHGRNKLRPQLPRDEWSITVVDSDDTHYYQPGYLFVPFGIYRPDEIVKPKKRFIPTGVDLVLGEIDKVVPEDNKVLLVDGTELGYDYLIIASGTTPRPEETPGMADDLGGSVHEFYTFEGATALAEKLRTWEGGRLVVHITEMPIKCPVAPLEFTFLADAFFPSRACATRSRSSMSPRSRAPSPSRSPASTSATCSRPAASPSRVTSWSRASTRRPRSWSASTSARCPTTCWSRSR